MIDTRLQSDIRALGVWAAEAVAAVAAKTAGAAPAGTAGDPPPRPASTAAAIPPPHADLPTASVRADRNPVGLDGNPTVPLAPGLPLPVALSVDTHHRQQPVFLPPRSAAWRGLAVTSAATVEYRLAAAAAPTEVGLSAGTVAAAASAADVERLHGAVSRAQARRIAT